MFCDNCGNKVNEIDRFCENCGHALATEESGDNKFQPMTDCDLWFTAFSSPNWEQNWGSIVDRCNCLRYGIILTNTNDCPQNLKEKFYDTLKTYVNFRAEHKVCYCILDLAHQNIKHAFNSATLRSVNFVVEILKEISKVATPQCVMIVGDRTSIDSIRWYNPLVRCGDPDEYIHSDLPYITLDTSSSFQRSVFNFDIEIGRLPSNPKNGFEEAIRYLTNTINLHNSNRSIKTLVSTAIQWTASSALTYKSITNKELYPCPDVSFIPGPKINRVLNNYSSHNLLCFNFHGSPMSNDWVWEDEDADPLSNQYYKSAYSPECLPSNSNIAYAICTEACYGAKPTDNQSILMTALQNRCLAYVGSSESAYGAANYVEASLSADVLAKQFSYYTYQGFLFGSAFLKALTEMFTPANNYNLNWHEIKTITTFALYGDPTLSLLNSNIKTFDHTPKNYSDYHIPLPSIHQTIELQIEKVRNY